MYEIDFVIPTVDGSDPEWQKRFIEYKSKETGFDKVDISVARYRQGVDLRYWFRSVEKYAPWVRRIHLITDGQLPEWVNLDCPKLHWVKHSEIIPSKYLPIFNCNPFEVNLHKIEGLADRFVYFNDDMFITDHVSPERFFRNGLPVDMAVLQPEMHQSDIMKDILSNNIDILNKSFYKWSCMAKNPQKWFSMQYRGLLLQTLKSLSNSKFVSFWEHHFSHSYLKRTFEEVWSLHPNRLEEVCSHRFRHSGDVNQWLFAYWQLSKGNFYPYNYLRDSKSFYKLDKEVNCIEEAIKTCRYKMILLNDTNDMDNYDETINKIESAFKYTLPNKSQFER